jgi:energy-coupling factor transport system ATP-binding protein
MADRIVVMNKGKVALDGKPGEIFSKGQELKVFGLDVPQVTQITDMLRVKGYELPRGIHTVSEAVYEIIKLKKEEGNA